MAGYSFQIFKDRKNAFRARFVARNGETMFSTEGYTSKASVMNAVKSILKNGPNAAIEDMTKANKAAPKGKAAAKPARGRAAAKPKRGRAAAAKAEKPAPAAKPKRRAAARKPRAPKAAPAPEPMTSSPDMAPSSGDTPAN